MPSKSSGKLRVGNGCRKLLIWEYSVSVLKSSEKLTKLQEGLLDLGFVDVTRFDKIREFVDSSGHSLIIVPATERVQIRVHYLTPEGQRRTVAREIASKLETAERQAHRASSEHRISR